MTPRTRPIAQAGDVYLSVKTNRVYKVVNVRLEDCYWSPYTYSLQGEIGAMCAAGNWLDDEKYFIRLPAECWRERRTMQLGFDL